MIRTTPFHERTSALNETGLWSHWSGHLAAHRYQMSDKFEYFAVRNSAGIFDSSPLYKYRIHGPDAERVPGRRARPRHPGLPARPRPVHGLVRRPRLRGRGRRRLPPRPGRVPADRRRAQPRLLRGPDRPATTSRSRRSADDYGDPRRPGPAVARPAGRSSSRASADDPLLRADDRQDRRLAGHGLADRLHRRPRLRDLDRSRRTR